MQRIIILPQSMLNRIQWGGWYFYKGFLNFALYFIILRWGKNMFIVMGQLDHSSYPKAPIWSAPCRIDQLLKVKRSCFTVCLLVCLFIYLFILYPSMHGSCA